MKVLKLHGRLDNPGGIAAFQRSLQGLNHISHISYYHFKTGRDVSSRLFSVPFFRYLQQAFSYLYFPFYLLWLRPDIIEINSSMVPGAFARDYWYARISAVLFPRSALVLFNHGWNDDAKRKMLATSRSKVLRYFRLFDCIFVLARRFSVELKEMGVNVPIEVVTTGVDASVFSPLEHRSDSERQRIVFLSRLERGKGLKDLLEAVPELVRRHPAVEVCIAGSGSYEHEARTHPSALSFPENIRFCGYVRGDEKRELLENSDIFVFPSYTEGFPVSVLEALAAGLPLVYTPVGALPDFLVDGRNGVQVRPAVSSDIVSAVSMLLDNPKLMAEISRRNRELSKNFDLRVVHQNLEDIYQLYG